MYSLTPAQVYLRAANTYRGSLGLPLLTQEERTLLVKFASAAKPEDIVNPPAPIPPPAPTYKLKFSKQMLDSPSSWGDVATQAQHSDILVLQYWETNYLKAAKAANPAIKVYAYQNATYANAKDQWGHQNCGIDLATAQKLGYATTLKNSFGLTLCDISKPGYGQAWISNVLARLSGLGFDGIYLDDFNIEAISPSLPSGVSASQWASALSSLVQAVNGSKGPYSLIANMNGTWGEHPAINPLLTYLDGGYNEFAITWPANNTVSQSFIDNSLAEMAAAQQAGKIYIANTVAASTSDTQRAFAGYCLALIGGASHYNVIANYSSGYGVSTIWLAQFGQDIGQPIGTYIKAGSLYTRRFEKALVSLNLSTLTGTIT